MEEAPIYHPCMGIGVTGERQLTPASAPRKLNVAQAQAQATVSSPVDRRGRMAEQGAGQKQESWGKQHYILGYKNHEGGDNQAVEQ